MSISAFVGFANSIQSAPPFGSLVIDENTLGFGFGKGDSVRLYEGDMLIGSDS